MSEKELITSYRLSNGTIFTDKMFYDLLMWKSFEEDYADKYKEEGIRAIRDRLGLNKDEKGNWIEDIL